jgi:hypothetical protein
MEPNKNADRLVAGALGLLCGVAVLTVTIVALFKGWATADISGFRKVVVAIWLLLTGTFASLGILGPAMGNFFRGIESLGSSVKGSSVTLSRNERRRLTLTCSANSISAGTSNGSANNTIGTECSLLVPWSQFSTHVSSSPCPVCGRMLSVTTTPDLLVLSKHARPAAVLLLVGLGCLWFRSATSLPVIRFGWLALGLLFGLFGLIAISQFGSSAQQMAQLGGPNGEPDEQHNVLSVSLSAEKAPTSA